MSSIRQYFETDFEYALRLKCTYPSGGLDCTAAVLYDCNAGSAFLAFYFENPDLTPLDFVRFLSTIEYGRCQFGLDGAVVLPAARVFHGEIHIQNADPPQIEYKLFGDPERRDLLAIPPSRRIFLYAETSFTPETIAELQTTAADLGHDLQYRDKTYMSMRDAWEKPLAFISHDSRDKPIARAIALNLQRKICSVWYDEFALALGANLRESIERGLKECRRCVLVLSQNFLNNRGWGKKEFESIFTREILEDKALVLPIWKGVTKQQVYEYSPSLLNIKGIDWDALGEDEVCRQIYVATTSNSV